MTAQPTPDDRPALREQPALTREEAIRISEEGFGSRPDLPPGSEFVRSVRGIWRGLRHRA